MIQLILMRHGNTFEEGQIPVQVGAKTDLPLTAFGKEQAKKMASFLRNYKRPTVIFAGGLKRQAESAEIIAREFHLEVHKTPALTEIDYGLWEGLSSDEIKKNWPVEYTQWTESAKWPKGIFKSSYEDQKAALLEWLKTLQNSFKMSVVFGVTSNGLLRLFRNEKVKTGHFCELHLHPDQIEIRRWSEPPV